MCIASCLCLPSGKVDHTSATTTRLANYASVVTTFSIPQHIVIARGIGCAAVLPGQLGEAIVKYNVIPDRGILLPLNSDVIHVINSVVVDKAIATISSRVNEDAPCDVAPRGEVGNQVILDQITL